MSEKTIHQHMEIEFMAYYEMYWSVKKYGKSLPYNLKGIFTPENLPETSLEMNQILWKQRLPNQKHCMGTYSGTSVDCTKKAEPGKLICRACQNSLTHYYCGGRYIGQSRLAMLY